MRQRVAVGRLLERAPDVFVVAGSVPTARQRLMVAVSEVGADAVATRRSAAALHQVPGFSFGIPEVLVRRSGDHLCTSGRLSETSWLPPEHVTARDGIPVVTLPRLCFELAATEKRGRLTRIVDDAQLLGMSIDALAEVVGCLAKRGRPGSTAMREEVEARGEGYVPPASELEALGFEVLRNGGLPEPVRQVDVGGEQWVGRVDCAYLDERLIIEFDGRRHWQASLEAEADRRRDAELIAAGWRVLRITWKMLTEDPEGVVRLVRAALAVGR